jgi:predicted ATPase
MNEKLIVKDFGPIKNAELDLKKVTVFIGPQGSGKSTLAKLVAICKEEERPFLFSEPSKIGFREGDYGLKSFKNKNSEFEYSSEFVTIGYSDNKFHTISNDLGSKIRNEISVIQEKGRENMASSNLDDLSMFNMELKQELEKLFVLGENNVSLSEIIYIPEKRTSITFLSSSLFGLMSNDVNLPKLLTEFGNKYAKASTREAKEDHRFIKADSYVPGVKKLKHIELFDLQFQHRDGQDFLIDLKNNYEVNLRDSASGMQSSIPLILVVRHEYSQGNGNRHFIIEEPELNLFPTTQKELVGYLADKCTQNDNELLMTTHSPYILSAINNLIFAYKVAHEVPEKAYEVAQIIPREQWLNPDDVAAYYVADGTVTSIIHEGEGLIGENELDAISEDISGERDQLFKILRSKKRETVH